MRSLGYTGEFSEFCASVVLLEGTVRDTAAGLGSAWTGKTLVEARQGLRGGDEPGVLVSADARGEGETSGEYA